MKVDTYINLYGTIQIAFENYLAKYREHPRTLYVGEKETLHLYSEYGGVLLELHGCRLVVVEKDSYLAFGN